MKPPPGWEIFSRRHPVLVYSAARFVIFVLAIFLLSLVGLGGLTLVVVGLLVSAVVSYLLLRGQRDLVSGAVERRASRTRERLGSAGARSRRRLDDAAASEDDD